MFKRFFFPVPRSTRSVQILKAGKAQRVIFFFPPEEGSYVENVHVTLFENGIVHVHCDQETTTTHIYNCEIVWRFEAEKGDGPSKIRLLRPNNGPSPSTPSPGGNA